MNYLHYQYCLSDFILTDEYQIEDFNKVTNQALTNYYLILLKNINSHTNNNYKNLNSLIRRVHVTPEEITKYIDEDNKQSSYDPLIDTPELYSEMHKIKFFNEKSLRRFIDNYGIPFHMYFNEQGYVDSTLFKKNTSEKFLVEMDVFLFYEKLVEFKSAFKMWHDISQGEFEEIRKINARMKLEVDFIAQIRNLHKEELTLEEFADIVLTNAELTNKGGEIEAILEDYKKHPDKLIKLNEKATEISGVWSKVKSESEKTIALAYLNLKLKELDSGRTSTRFIDGKIVPAISFNNLVEVASYQLKQAIFKEQKFKVCLNCGDLFEPRHASQRFCSPLPGRKRSTCENTYNQRQKRLRKKQGGS
ncbi:hypothetical protein [Halobacillus mangrovi]|uniref:Uncharacterized protein n=1 Tax=Halobacillus mangrovi TaxID=402384 RepID=A0A1W5ZZX5_9BACI|nr:hypothetical protein [Halobacillus mangrovi]ARI78812.1 hypothetical protein HM131_19090 [Halobacillus mangrovi]